MTLTFLRSLEIGFKKIDIDRSIKNILNCHILCILTTGFRNIKIASFVASNNRHSLFNAIQAVTTYLAFSVSVTVQDSTGLAERERETSCFKDFFLQSHKINKINNECERNKHFALSNSLWSKFMINEYILIQVNENAKLTQ